MDDKNKDVGADVHIRPQSEETEDVGAEIDRPKTKLDYRLGFLFGVICSILGIVASFGGQYLVDNISLDLSWLRPSYVEDNTDYDSVFNERTERKISDIEEAIRQNYYGYEDISYEELEVGLYRGLVDALTDPYAEYYTADEMVAANAHIQGVFYGIGALLSFDEDKKLTVISGILEGGSAEESDLREGDYIVKVDDVDVSGYSTTEVVSLVRGKENTVVTLTIYREGAPDYLIFELIRKKAIEQTSVSHGIMDDENIGYIRIYSFDNATVHQFAEALDELLGLGIKGLIIDLRSNPGGSLNAVNAIARRILPKGLIVYTEDSKGKREKYSCDGKNEIKIPLTVLVNEYSASASEILAGAVQDHNKGTVIGTTTYGKGSVQRIFNLPDGSGLKLTVSTYYTPLGRSLGGSGIVPDIEIELDRDAYYEDGTDSQLEKAMEVLKEEIE
ncbi:MAG: S41 family peptidase [Lachnospiraceae bacterium]|jgi:carboxyl-terminal processing protease|nr:S41 family peptidase [Lachnospiraceae bacterium]